ncbi:MAG: hypothetical protein Q8R05_01130, partial [Candidatus Omnitrophota bacterium]|nr:hypothetical protein [Candidatus Omnitrophota bacterium]
LLDIQEIRNELFDTRGNVLVQRIATFASDWTILDVKVITNESLDALGNAAKVTIKKYAQGLVDADGYIQYQDFMDVTVIETSLFDKRGNALTQTVKKYSDEAGTTLIETQSITNAPYDFMDRATRSTITTTNSTGLFVDKQIIDYLGYDSYGNVVDQTIERYGELDTLIDYKVIHNTYADMLAARRGNATRSTITRYTSKETLDDTTLIERQEIYNNSFDTRGNIVDQAIELFVDGKMAKRTVIHNSSIDNRGNAQNQSITSFIYNPVTFTADIETGFQEILNRTFDSDSNVKDQQVKNYLDSTKTLLLDIQEIRNELFDTRGNVLVQRIATFASDWTILDVKVITNESLDALG